MLFQKYLALASSNLQQYLAYRVNFIFWRLQVVISFLTFYFLWFAISLGKSTVGSYTLPQIYSYFVIGYIIRALVFSTRTADIGGDIQNGNLSVLLLKPIGTIKYYFSRDIIDKIFNLFFMAFEFIFIIIFLRPSLTFPTLTNFFFFLLSLVIAIVIFFFYSLVISFATFWTDQAWSSRFLFGVVFINLLSGQYLPLDLLPSGLGRILNYTPFPYLYYYPVRFWLGKESPQTALFILLASLCMLIFFYFLSQLLWLWGKRRYQSYGY